MRRLGDKKIELLLGILARLEGDKTFLLVLKSKGKAVGSSDISR